MRHTILFLTASLALAPGLTRAATICVDPQGGTCETTIQAAVDRAAPADVVSIAAGVYFESVRIPAGKQDLQVVGAGMEATIVDSGPFADLGITDLYAISFFVESARVRFTRLTVRNGAYGLWFRAPGGFVDAVRVQGARSIAVHGDVGSIGLRVIGSTIEASQQGVVARADQAVVRGNLFNRGASNAVLSQGARTLIEVNRLEGPGGIDASGADVIVRDNVLRTVASVALVVSGRNPRVSGNVLTEVDAGILAACPQIAAPTSPPPAGACAGAVFASNTVTDATGDAFVVIAHAPGLRVENNRVLRSGGSFSLNGTGILAASNSITDSGRTMDFPCFEAFGADHVLTGNVAARCTSEGFLVQGDRVRLANNRALNGFGGGITVTGINFPNGPHVDAMLVGNTANENAGAGIAILGGAAGTTVTGNTALRNQVDYCDHGVGTVASGNRFGRIGLCTQ